MSDLVINESNFNEYFFDVRLHKPKPKQVMASYTVIAELNDGPEKRQIIELLRLTDKVSSAIQIVQKGLSAKERDSYRLLREMAEDLLSGMSVEDVAAKPYQFTMELCFWTQVEHIPRNDPHWACVSILNLEDYFAKKDITVTSKIIEDVYDGQTKEENKISLPEEHL